MKYENEEISIEKGLEKEWIITNGIGGFCSSTIVGANTRKYHGLLIAPLSAPARRHLILSKLDESVEIGNHKFNLYTNVGKTYISEGYKYQISFEKEYVPTFEYEVEGVRIQKLVCMQYGKNTVEVVYKIQNKDKKLKLTLAPVLNFRDFHTMSTDHNFQIRQEIKANKVKSIIDNKSDTPVYFYASDGEYIEHKNDIYRNMFYIEEEKRGFYPEENHIVPGRYEIEIKPNENKEVSFVCSLEENIEEINTKDLIKAEKDRIDKIIKESHILENVAIDDEVAKSNKNKKKSKKQLQREELLKDYIKATDNFVVFRPSFGLHTIIAGYPWFLDWGRDALIAFEGLLLVTKRYEIAKEVLKTFMRDIKFGLVPNGYSGFDNRPLYNSSDASLLLFEQIKKYLNYTGDMEFVKEIYHELVKVIDAYKKGIDVDNNNIYVDSDYLLVAGTPQTQNTWMDAKYGDFAVTPRNGKAVELNSLWYNALKIMEEFSLKLGETKHAKTYQNLAKKCQRSFMEKFYNSKRKCLYDVLGDSKIRPNQLFSLSLTYPILDPASKEAREMFETVTKKLLNKYGLKTLAKGEKNYVDVYEGDSFRRDVSYHQGITWPWLLGLYYDSFKKIVDSEKDKKEKDRLAGELEKFRDSVDKTFEKAMYQEGMVGSISELYDSKRPQLPKGAPAQAWSVAEVLRIIMDK